MKFENNNFTIYEVENIKKEFITVLNEDNIIIDFENISKIDMSAIQLLLSFKKTCEERKKSFEIINIRKEILDSFDISGTTHILGV